MWESKVETLQMVGFDFQQLLEVKIVLFMTTRLCNMLIREILTE